MSKVNYKVYPIENVETALEVLGDLIRNVIYDLELHKTYHNELRELAIKYFSKASEDELKNKTINIPTDEYYNIKDKISYRQMMLLQNLSDEQKTSFSYINLRRFLKQKNYLCNSLPEDVSKHLNELLRLRNWTFHNTQSNYTANKEVANKEVPHNCSVRRMFNPVIINKYQFVDIKELISYDELLDQR